MKSTSTRKQSATKDIVASGKQRSYNEVIEFLDAHWTSNANDTTLSVMKQLDKAFDSVSQKIDSIFITGTNGKSLTAHFTTRLLREEGLTVGTFYDPHVLTYNERFSLNNEIISNKIFTDIANEVINSAESMQLTPNSCEVLTMMALLYFKRNNVDVAIIESTPNSPYNATSICTPKITAITRVNDPDSAQQQDEETQKLISEIVALIAPKSYAVSADQSKINLQSMQKLVSDKGGIWAMPIRKLTTLNYPFEQLHGRCAALAERTAHIYVNTFANKKALAITTSLLTKTKGQRGRPTLEAKRQSEINPKKTLDQFWKDTVNTLPGRFQLLDKEKPTVLLDNASNIDALKNVLLGIRLLHYQRPLKGLAIVLGCDNETINKNDELLKVLRYFFKKNSGQIILCPTKKLAWNTKKSSLNVDKLANSIKGMKMKVRVSKNLKEALALANSLVDERNGLVIVTGSISIVAEYWQEKGIKKL